MIILQVFYKNSRHCLLFIFLHLNILKNRLVGADPCVCPLSIIFKQQILQCNIMVRITRVLNVFRAGLLGSGRGRDIKSVAQNSCPGYRSKVLTWLGYLFTNHYSRLSSHFPLFPSSSLPSLHHQSR